MGVIIDELTSKAYQYYNKWAEQQLLPRKQRWKSGLDLWLDAMEWEGVEELSINRQSMIPEVVSKLPPRMSSLRQLETAHLPFIQALKKNSLTNLSWIGPSTSHDLTTILNHHGESLQRLEFLCPEVTCPEFPLLLLF